VASIGNVIKQTAASHYSEATRVPGAYDLTAR
jgi:hypothetical protein